MSGSGLNLYADERTRAVLRGSRSCVLLIGGYLGYPNFGDILQLKATIRWHRERTGLEPVPICDVGAITDAEFPERVRRWFDVEGLVFVNTHRVDLDEIGLPELTEPLAAPCLHLYGGGFLNRLWGETMLAWVEGLHQRFGVAHYVVSGQQVEPAFVPQLSAHFTRCLPLIAGGRDPISVEALGECGVSYADSFDDATEALQSMARTHAACLKSSPATAHGLLHLNLSPYAQPEQSISELNQCASLLHRFRDHLVRTHGEPIRLTLLQAYTDRRVDAAIDTLSVVQQLEDAFPFVEYRVIDLGRLALAVWSEPSEPTEIRFGASMALTCSYHVTLLCTLMGIPCYLWANNSYYAQKKAGLGLCTGDIEAFLNKPVAPSLEARLAARSAWLNRLESVYSNVPTHRTPACPPSPTDSPERRKWVPKTLLTQWCAGVHSLEAGHHWLEEQWSRWKETAEQRGRVIDELKSWAEELDRGRAWLENQLESHKKLLAEREAELQKLKNPARQTRSPLNSGETE